MELAAQEDISLGWSVVVVGPYFTGAMLARSLGDSGDDSARRFDYRVTYDRTLVLAAATVLMRRIPSPAPPTT